VVEFGNGLPFLFSKVIVGKLKCMPMDFVRVIGIPIVFFAQVFVVSQFGDCIV